MKTIFERRKERKEERKRKKEERKGEKEKVTSLFLIKRLTTNSNI